MIDVKAVAGIFTVGERFSLPSITHERNENDRNQMFEDTRCRRGDHWSSAYLNKNYTLSSWSESPPRFFATLENDSGGDSAKDP